MSKVNYLDDWEYYEELAETVQVPTVRVSKKDKEPQMKMHSQEFITISGRDLVYRPYEYKRNKKTYNKI